jgi:hypothetical protein
MAPATEQGFGPPKSFAQHLFGLLSPAKNVFWGVTCSSSGSSELPGSQCGRDVATHIGVVSSNNLRLIFQTRWACHELEFRSGACRSLNECVLSLC